MSQAIVSRSVGSDPNEVVECTCMRMRKATRRITQIYDQTLSPSQLTSPQFGLLAYLNAAADAGEGRLQLGILAERLGMDPTTLNRNLKPLEAQDLLTTTPCPNDRRVRLVGLTDTGRASLLAALPLWREARDRVRAQVGVETLVALNSLLDLATAKLAA